MKQKGFTWKNSVLSRNVPVSACQCVVSTQQDNEGLYSWSGYTGHNLNDPSCQANCTSSSSSSSSSRVRGTSCMYKLLGASSGRCHCFGSFTDTSPAIYREQQVITATNTCDQWRNEGGGVGGFKHPRNSEVLTKSNRIAN